MKQQKDKLLFAKHMHWIHWLVILSSVVITVMAWKISKDQMDEKVKSRFDREASQLIELVSERMAKYEDALWGGVSAINANNGNMTYDQWLIFSKSLRIDVKYPGINGIGVIYHLSPLQLEGFLHAQQKRRPSFRIYPKHQNHDLFPITYIEPAYTNAQAVGLDIAHEKNRYQAALKARDTGKAQITGPIVLVQDEAKTPGFLFYAPFYKNDLKSNSEERKENFRGLVYAPFVMSKLIAGTLRKESRHVGISIKDGKEVLYDENNPQYETFDSTPMFTQEVKVNVYGRDWDFNIRSTKDFRYAANNAQPLIILVSGITIDCLLFIIFIALARTNKRALLFAQEMNKEALVQKQKKAQVVAEKEQFLRKILEALPVAVFCKEYINGKGEFILWNNFAEEIWGLKREEVIGKSDYDFFPKEQADFFREKDLETIEKNMQIYIDEEEVDSPTVGKRFVRTWKIPILSKSHDRKSGMLIGISLDISEHKELQKNYEEEKLKSINSARLASLGEMAGGVAHEINNPLAIITGLMMKMRKLLNKDSGELNEIVEKVDDTVLRISKIVRGMRALSRDGSTDEKEEVELNVILEDALGVCSERFKSKGIELKISIQDNHLPIMCRRVEIAQVLVNLLNNAYDAVSDLRSAWVEVVAKKAGDKVIIEVRDSGHGIHQSDKSKIMEPFYTTKKMGEGTGLGLSISKRILRNHGGNLHLVEDQENTCFQVELPYHNLGNRSVA